MKEDPQSEHRRLVARVATLELLVADLIDRLWQVDPAGMDALARTADHDLTLQQGRTMPAGGEHQRHRLQAVLQDRRRKLQRRRVGEPA